ncbi:16S rRNA (guanine(966)-N(2))-methyltransferase RsmD [Cellvibrio fibrivorans]|uniref:Ribosomal RNA small subunit methyltransferase D n=1 Tax=Cellvibrio fibrivorans TaxID=126350 RepID=A0ABU1UU94_9GAMM|nr:16S rRNA (guanine(966)-N(2))-methyltransferase RsmD [Cellvibrio fibrivorans]MDR7088759.1 16S rRNA (guanine966-N2)-methyltransferase [Cellvibrio fibrivorans]
MPKPVAKSSKPKPAGSNQLRIIGGIWRGRKLSFPDVNGLRPTGDRIRETLFNWLAPDIQGARCLDLFAGSGALGLEALSRGAASSLLLEKHAAAAQQLKSNLQLLQADNGRVEQVDSLQWLKQQPPKPFDIVFIDPPFALELWEPIAAELEAQDWLSDAAVIYLEAPRDAQLQLPGNWQLHRDKQAGQVSFRLYHRHTLADSN